VSSRDALRASIEQMAYVDLPLLYINAAIHKDIISEIRTKAGRLFGCRIPDIYSGLVISYLCGEFLSVSVPFSLAGLSGSSNGVSADFNGSNAAPRNDFVRLNSAANMKTHAFVPDLPIYPYVPFAESFYCAQENLFKDDAEFSLPRERVLRACADRADVTDAGVQSALRKAADGDPALLDMVDKKIDEAAAQLPPIRLRPAALGFDGANLHLDASDFDVKTIKDAVDLVHNLIWPNNQPIKYEVVDSYRQLLERTEALDTRTAELAARTAELVDVRAELVARTQELVETRAALVDRTDDLVSVRALLVERTAMLEHHLRNAGAL
jgi:hypothetical protein